MWFQISYPAVVGGINILQSPQTKLSSHTIVITSWWKREEKYINQKTLMKDRRGQDVMADEMGEIINYPTSKPAATSSLSSFIIIHRVTLLCAKKNCQSFVWINIFIFTHRQQIRCRWPIFGLLKWELKYLHNICELKRSSNSRRKMIIGLDLFIWWAIITSTTTRCQRATAACAVYVRNFQNLL